MFHNSQITTKTFDDMASCPLTKNVKVVEVVVVVVVLLSEAGDGVEVALMKPDLLVICHRLLDEVLDVAVIAVGGLHGADVSRFNL